MVMNVNSVAPGHDPQQHLGRVMFGLAVMGDSRFVCVLYEMQLALKLSGHAAINRLGLSIQARKT
jgi:hypothetical protein